MRFLASLVLLLCVLGSQGRLVSYCNDFKQLNGGPDASGLIYISAEEGIMGTVRIIPEGNYTVVGHVDTCLNFGGQLWESNSTGSNLTLSLEGEMLLQDAEMDYGFDEKLMSLVFYNAKNAKTVCCDLVNYYDLYLELVSMVETEDVHAAILQDSVNGTELVLALISGSNSTADSIELVLSEIGCLGVEENAEVLNITRPSKEHYYTVAMEIEGVSSKKSVMIPEASICEEFQVMDGSMPTQVPTDPTAAPTTSAPVETGNPNYISSASGIALSIVSALAIIVAF